MNFFKLAVRQIFKNRLFSFVNFTGLAIGLAFCFLTIIWYQFEHSFDRHFPTAERLYRMDYSLSFTGSTFSLTRTPTPFAPLLRDFFPEIEQTARLFPRSISLRTLGNNREFEIPIALFADSTAQQVFGFETLAGDVVHSLRSPFSLVLTNRSAQRFFGTEAALGQQVMLANEGPFTVGAVVRAQPENSHLDFDLLVPFRNIADVEPAASRENVLDVLETNKMASYAYTYILLRPGADATAVNARFKPFLMQHGIPEMRDKQNFILAAVPKIHLTSEAQDEPVSPADGNFLNMFLLIGGLILVIAVVNFVNLSTATQLARAKEVGVRKAMGSSPWQLVRQMLGETLVLGLPAFFTALGLVQLMLPQMETFFGRSPEFSFFTNGALTLTFAGIFLLTCLLAGLYPAFFAAKFKAVDIFRGTAQGGGRQKNWLSTSLITLQFTVAVALLVSAGIILKQIDFLQNRPLGFDRDLVLGVPLRSQNMNSNFASGDPQLRSRTNTFEEKLLQNSKITAVTMASVLPGVGSVRHPVATDKIRIEDGVVLPANSVDYDFVKTFGLKIVAGRDFDKSYGTDHLEGFIINQEAVKTLGWANSEEAVGQNIRRGSKNGRVVGVVNDFNVESLRTGMQPLLLEVSPGTFTQFAIKIAPGDLPNTLDFIEKTWGEHFPEKVFEHTFLDQRIADSYSQEARFGKLISLFAGIAIFLSCFGLFGMIVFVVRKRTKEIGIRKVLGASVAGITGLLAKNFLKLVLASFVLAFPLAYFFSQRWLEDFAYRIDIQWWMFVLAGAIAVIIAFLTVSIQSIKAALANPVESLRSE
ncbi:MAG: ABC transporter permease [Saprospiraceae bacterium]|nr:ABC transporter permease [Saprospiraceae bacterium]